MEEAVAVYNKSLMEHRTADTLKRLNETEKKLKVRGRGLLCVLVALPRTCARRGGGLLWATLPVVAADTACR